MNRVAKEQVPVAEQTVQSMVAVSGIARSTESAAEQTLQLTESLGETAQRLSQAISTFKIAK